MVPVNRGWGRVLVFNRGNRGDTKGHGEVYPQKETKDTNTWPTVKGHNPEESDWLQDLQPTRPKDSIRCQQQGYGSLHKDNDHRLTMDSQQEVTGDKIST